MPPTPAPPFPSDRRQAQSWASGAKDVVTTSLTGRVWATVGQGIINEIFWPGVDQPQTKDFGFLVRTDAGPDWREVKVDGDYQIVPADDPAVPLPSVKHLGDFYQLDVEVLPDPGHDALLVAYQLTGTAGEPPLELRLYPLLAPHLGRCTAQAGDGLGMDNSAWVDDGALYASDAAGDHVLCLLADPGFTRTSVGYVGDSDGWTDLAQHRAMTWEYTSAGPGVVALMGELVAPGGILDGTLAVGFGTDPGTARAAATAALQTGAAAARTTVTEQWQTWAQRLTLPTTGNGLSDEVAAAVRQSAGVLHVNEDRTVPGAIVAGLATPWGDQTNEPGGYHMVWCRDSCETALALAALGDLDSGTRLLDHLARRQDRDATSPTYGSWARCYFLDGTSLADLQLDEIAFPVLLAAKLAELGAALPASTPDMVRAAITFLVRSGPADGDDRWEETQGASPFTLALIVVALIVAARALNRTAGVTDDEQTYLLSLADNWNERLEEFTYIRGGLLDRAFGTTGHYVRIGPPAANVRLGNQPAETSVAAELMVGLEFLYLTRLGLRDPRDTRISDTLEIVDTMLLRRTPAGEAFDRYDMDGYGEWLDGSGWPVRHFGIGRPWPLLTGERGHHEALLGQDPTPRLQAMLAMRGRGGLIPEQVWDADPLPWRRLAPGRPTGSAMPLAWAHSELIKLAVTATTGKGRPVERLQSVEAHYPDATPRRTTTWYWRDNGPVLRLPTGCTLLIEDHQPFTLHYAFDNWQHDLGEQEARPGPFGMFSVSFSPDRLQDRGTLDFTRRYQDGRWEGNDHAVVLNVTRPDIGALPLPPREYGGRAPYPRSPGRRTTQRT